MVKKYAFLMFFMAVAMQTLADTWSSAEITITYSENKEYMLKVYPRKYPDNYHTNKYQRQYKKGIIKDTVTACHAVLYHIFNSDTVELWNKPLVNFESPVRILVANDGKSVVTIDDWGMKGYEHTIAIYDASGEIIKDFNLEDITPFPIEQYARSISSIHWGGNVKYLDNNRVEIHFENEVKEKKERIFNIKKKTFE